MNTLAGHSSQKCFDAVEQIGLSMAANAFPLFYVAQNVYDTSESVWNVWNSRNSTDELTKIETGIDLVFAVVGWVPVVGAGVKRSFRLVNHKSEIYGPLLFDILRLVLQRAGVHTSPEELVDKPMADPNAKRSMDRKLGLANRVKDAVRPAADELIEPPVTYQGPASVSSPAPGGKPVGGRNRPKKQAPPKEGGEGRSDPAQPTGKMVQMSHEWILHNLPAAVPLLPVRSDIQKKG